MGADDDACREEAKNDHRKEKQNIAGIDHAFLDALKMSHNAESRDRFAGRAARFVDLVDFFRRHER